MGKETWVEYQHVLRPSVKGNIRKEEYDKFSQSKHFKGYYKVIKTYEKDESGNINEVATDEEPKTNFKLKKPKKRETKPMISDEPITSDPNPESGDNPEGESAPDDTTEL